MPKPENSQKKMVQYSKQSRNLSPVRKRLYNTQTVPKPANSKKKMVKYSNRAKNCHLSEKDVKYSNRAKPVNRKRWCNSQTEQNCHQSENDGTILKQSQNL